MATYKKEDLRRVFFGSLPEECDEMLMYELCTQFGPVANVTWPSMGDGVADASNKRTFCFVDFRNSEDAKYCFEALYRCRLRLFGKEVRVSHVSTDLQQRMQGAKASSRHAVDALHEIGAKVVVRGVDTTATEYEISSFFEQFGAFAVPPRMKRDTEGNFRGVVILSYDDFRSSDRVIKEMNEHVFRDQPISVQYAELEDGSGRVHGSEEERANAVLFKEEAKLHAERIAKEKEEYEKELQQRRMEDTSWAANVNLYSR